MNLIKKYGIGIIVIFAVAMFIKPVLCFLIVGVLISYMGLEAILFLRNISKKGIEWTGNIIEYQSGYRGYKTPLIEFTSQAGELVREKPYVYASTDLSKIRTYKNSINQPVPILYDPDSPQKFVLTNERKSSYVTFFIFIVAGLFFTGLSIASLLGYIKIW